MKKLALIGGGSVRTYYFIESLLKFYKKMEIGQVAVMDNDPENYDTLGALPGIWPKERKADWR